MDEDGPRNSSIVQDRQAVRTVAYVSNLQHVIHKLLGDETAQGIRIRKAAEVISQGGCKQIFGLCGAKSYWGVSWRAGRNRRKLEDMKMELRRKVLDAARQHLEPEAGAASSAMASASGSSTPPTKEQRGSASQPAEASTSTSAARATLEARVRFSKQRLQDKSLTPCQERRRDVLLEVAEDMLGEPSQKRTREMAKVLGVKQKSGEPLADLQARVVDMWLDSADSVDHVNSACVLARRGEFTRLRLWTRAYRESSTCSSVTI